MMKSTWLFLMNEIWINTCFVKSLVWLFNTGYRDIFWDYYHTVTISYRYNPMWDDSPVWSLLFIIINSHESWQFLWFQSNSSVFNSWTECRSPETERTWCTFFLPRYHSLVPLNANTKAKKPKYHFLTAGSALLHHFLPMWQLNNI